MTFQRIQKMASTKSETPTTSHLSSRPFAPIIQHPIPTPHQQPEQTKGLVQRKKNLLEIPLMPPPKKVIQAKLTIGEPGDKYEQSADAIARQVVQRIHQPQSDKLQREFLPEEEKLQAQLDTNTISPEKIQKFKLQNKLLVQRLVSNGGMTAAPNLSASSDGVIQRDEEVDAVAHTANLGIRRANRRGSLDETGPESNFKVTFLREAFPVIQGELLKLANSLPEPLEVFRDSFRKLSSDTAYLTAIVSQLLEVGKCGEFSASVYIYLMQNTTNKAIYIAHMKDHKKAFNHQFVITSTKFVSDASDLDPEDAVLDAWYNYKVIKLWQFYDGINPYGAKLDASNISLGRRNMSTGESPLRDEVIQHVYNIVQPWYLETKRDHFDSLSVEEQREFWTPLDHELFDFDRSEPRVVKDLR
ncbi:hypothetical protein [Nostoc sp. NMS4]|uniref:hypothetical protein n=1 Tax=Nostoc sp. NMS4 TaxID=2815390 RepID=UPI0025F5D550|nr:hypothetical protein [Nostoc sp. NMS4]MBN3922517.1 hypothetical protein [Nostoc sp. NMS4]